MRKGLLKTLLLSLMLIHSAATFAQIFTEDFSGGTVPAAGWTIIGGAEANWKWYNTNNAGGNAPEAAFAWGPPYYTGVSRMITPEIATSGYTSLVLEFYSYVWDFAGSGYSYKIETTSDGGDTWNEVWSISPSADVPSELITLVINNADVGSDNFQFAVTFDGTSANINYWYFDDFTLSENTEDTYTVTYIVRDEDNNPVEDAQVNMQSAGTITTDASGLAVFEGIFAGEYAWWTLATGMSSESGSVTVTDEDVFVEVDLSISLELLSEYFATGTFPPEGWSISGDGQSNWSQSFSDLAGGPYPELRFSNFIPFIGNSKFVSPEVDTEGYTVLFLEFDYFLDDNSGSDYSIKVESTSDGGTTWNEIWSVSPTEDMGPNSETIIISTDDVGSEVFQFAFTFDGNSAQIESWFIDNVVLIAALQYDAAVVTIDMPALIAPGVDIDPSVEVGNMGSEIISFDVTFEFTDGTNLYSETLTVTDLASLETETVVFPTWTAIAGSFDGETYVTLIDDENLENDTVTFGIEVASGLVAKKPLYEMFTSSTCPPCPFANEALDGLLDENPNEYTLIKYQMNWPGAGDPYYTEECGVRGDYYDIFSVPDLYVNSEHFFPAVDITQADFDEFQDAETALIIEITEATIDSDNMVSIGADLVSAANYSAGLSAHIVIVEKLTVGNVGSNGETEFHYVMMKMLPDASGETLDEIVTGVTTTLTESYDMDLTNMETADDLAVVVFVQDDTDKSVVQSAMMDITFTTGIENNLYSQEKIKLYPNPASNNLMIESALAIQKIEIYNQVGQLVKFNSTNGNTLNLNIADLESGVYFVKVFSEGSVITKSLVVE